MILHAPDRPFVRQRLGPPQLSAGVTGPVIQFLVGVVSGFLVFYSISLLPRQVTGSEVEQIARLQLEKG